MMNTGFTREERPGPRIRSAFSLLTTDAGFAAALHRKPIWRVGDGHALAMFPVPSAVIGRFTTDPLDTGIYAGKYRVQNILRHFTGMASTACKASAYFETTKD